MLILNIDDSELSIQNQNTVSWLINWLAFQES